ncbi:tetratricopeptide repeat protein [Dokdonella koreensis]|uniref:PAS/PAC sensor protein n=1 Tax=Dokdonella koreensis DS-123 TaxID=1300342 RepID=A0A160DTW3_9GAMM|nr:tetratricopeptide repeat protein [Dokdonella koreensis]ANB17847.1 Putative PAS/PAC sensor protein [Dokdonella koreensis DS-123]
MSRRASAGAAAGLAWLILLAGALQLGAAQGQDPPGADEQPLSECRALRHPSPARAATVCAAAADRALAQGRTSEAVEAMFHASEAAQALGEFEAAERWLAQIERSLREHGTAEDRFRLARRTGMLAFRRDRPADALHAFERARVLAGPLGDRERAIAFNDLGIVQRKLGDYPAALSSFIASLELRSRAGQEQEVGPALQNIADVYREAGDLDQAEAYLRKAIQLHTEGGVPLKAAHAHESLGLVAAARGDTAAAATAYAAAAAIFDEAQAAPDRLRVVLRQADLASSAGDAAALTAGLAAAGPLVEALGGNEPLAYVRLDAERLALAGRPREAFGRLSARLDRDDPSDALAERQQALARLAAWAEALGDWRPALALQRRAFEAQQALDERQRSEVVDRLRIRYGLAERERELAQLELESSRQQGALKDARRTRDGLLAAAAAILLALLALHRRRVWQLRLQAERSRVQLEQELDRFRAAAARLRADRHRLRLALDRAGEPLLLVDAAGQVYLANRAARALLGRPDAEPSGSPEQLADWIEPGQAQRIGDWLRGLDDAPGAPVAIDAAGAGMWLMPLALEEELIVLGLSAAAGPDAQTRHLLEDLRDAHARDESTLAPATPPPAGAAPEAFRRALVALMRAAVDAWESSTRKSRLDLAEASGVWRITIDDGRLRVRTMERYLGMERMPERPRWREVLRTAYFVLAECPLDTGQRERLRGLIDAVKALAR